MEKGYQSQNDAYCEKNRECDCVLFADNREIVRSCILLGFYSKLKAVTGQENLPLERYVLLCQRRSLKIKRPFPSL